MSDTIIKTGDGSSSVISGQFGVSYHSTHGALTESKHVFIQAGLHALIHKPITQLNILEMGFGTGLNAVLTFLELQQKHIVVHYHAYEKYPLDDTLIEHLGYPALLDITPSFFKKFHGSEAVHLITPEFMLFRHKDILDIIFQDNAFNLIYWDAFDYDTQPALWSVEIFSKIYKSCASGAIIVTYAAKGQIRRNLIEAGFKTERLPGPPGKREMLRAFKM